jgi:hypothetical protein
MDMALAWLGMDMAWNGIRHGRLEVLNWIGVALINFKLGKVTN